MDFSAIATRFGNLQSTTISSLIIAVVLSFVYYKALPKPIPGIPYNKDSAKRISGDLPDLIKHMVKTRERQTWFNAQNVKHNSPIVQIFLRPFSSPVVLLNDFREAEDIFTRRTREFDRSTMTTLMFEGIIPHSTIVMPSHDLFREQRKLWAGTMTTDFLNTVAARAIYQGCEDFVELWRLKATLAGDAPFQANKDLRNLTMDVIWRITLGSETGALGNQISILRSLKPWYVQRDELGAAIIQEAPMNELTSTLEYLLSTLDAAMNSPFPKLQHFIDFTKPAYKRASKHKQNVMASLIKESRAKFAAEDLADRKPTSAMEVVLSREATAFEKTHVASAASSQQSMIDELFLFIAAGHETTATTLSWGVKFLARNRSGQSEARAALQKAYGNTTTPSLAQILNTSVPHLDALAHEMLRNSRTAGAVARISLSDTQLMGHFIPKGTQVIVPLVGWSHINAQSFEVDEKTRSATSQHAAKKGIDDWGDDVEAFKPERWLVQDGDQTVFNANAGPSMPMSAGPRGCFGKRLALMELKLILAFMLLNFELLPVEQELDSDNANEIVSRQPVQCFVRLRALERVTTRSPPCHTSIVNYSNRGPAGDPSH